MDQARIRLELGPTEAAILDESISGLLKEMRHEIAHTDDRQFRAGLHARLDTLEGILSQLSARLPA